MRAKKLTTNQIVVALNSAQVAFSTCQERVDRQCLFFPVWLSLKKPIPRIFLPEKQLEVGRFKKVGMIQFHCYANDRHCANNSGDAALLDDDKGSRGGERNESHENINNYVNVAIYKTRPRDTSGDGLRGGQQREREREGERESEGVALTTSEYLLSSLRWGWLVGGVGGGWTFAYFYQYLASCACAARSIPSDEPSRSTRRNRQRERKKRRAREQEREREIESEREKERSWSGTERAKERKW